MATKPANLVNWRFLRKITKFKTRQYYFMHYRSMRKGSRSPNLNSPMHSDDCFTKFIARQSFPLYGITISLDVFIVEIFHS